MSLMNNNELAKTKTVGANKMLLLLGIPPLRVYTIRIAYSGRNWRFSTSIRKKDIAQTVYEMRPWLLSTINRKSHVVELL